MQNNTAATDLAFCMDRIYAPASIVPTQPPMQDVDHKHRAYGAYTLHLNHKKVLFRIAKATPDRPGAFVTLWKRHHATSHIIPFDHADGIDHVFIFVKTMSPQKKEHKGHFFFDKQLLADKKIFSKNNTGGKLAMRVFPPWSAQVAEESMRHAIRHGIKVKKTHTMSAAAQKTQAWQTQYFVACSHGHAIDVNKVQDLWRTMPA